MEFLAYLNAESREIYHLVSRRTTVVENGHVCKKYDIFGYYNRAPNRLTICTDRILASHSPGLYINQTFLHEATHLAQACRQRMRAFKAFGLARESIKLTDGQRQDLAKAVAMHGRIAEYYEREAFWLEDKPNEVKYVVKKYCL